MKEEDIFYYVVDKQLQEVDDYLFETTGWKTVTLYEVIDGGLFTVFDFECTLDISSEEEILDRLSIDFPEEAVIKLVQL